VVWGRETASSARTPVVGKPGPQTPKRAPVRQRSRSPLASAGASGSQASIAQASMARSARLDAEEAEERKVEADAAVRPPAAGGQTPAAGGQTLAAGSAAAEGGQSGMFDWDALEAASGGPYSKAGGQTPGAGGETPATRRVPHVASHGPPGPRPPGMPPMMPPAGVAVRNWDRWAEVEKRYQPHPCLPP